MSFDPQSPLECRKRIAWAVAAERAVVTKEDAILLYNKIMDEWYRKDKKKY